MERIDLNCDLGESFGAYTIGMDSEVLPYITSANIACGFHGGDPLVMERTVAACARAGVGVGAHPGFPDLIGFGRRNMAVTPDEVRTYIAYQTGALLAFCHEQGVRMTHVKPHGALYNMAAKDYALAKAVCEGIRAADESLILLALSGSQMLKAAGEMGLACASEVFADRAYEPDGSLVPRSRPGSMIKDADEAARRVVRMVKEGKVQAIDGQDISIRADSVCVHGDSRSALDFVKRIRENLERENITCLPLERE